MGDNVLPRSLFLLFAAALPLSACGDPKSFSHLHCEWIQDGTKRTADYCYDSSGTVCGNWWPNDAEFCAWLVFYSQEQMDVAKFTESQNGKAKHEWTSESCQAAGDETQVEEYPPNPAQPNNTCHADNNGSVGSSDPPTTSDGTTEVSGSSTGETTSADETTGESGMQRYLCSKQATHQCADLDPNDALGISQNDPYTDPNDPLSGLWDECWSSVNSNPPKYKSKCVDAVSPGDARTQCEHHCTLFRTGVQSLCVAPDCEVLRNVDCLLDGSYLNANGVEIEDDFAGEQPVLLESEPNWECDGNDALPPPLVNAGAFSTFEDSGALITPEGVSAGMGSLRGYLSYSLSSCSASTCSLTVDAIVATTVHTSGGYSDAAGNGGTYSLDGTGFWSTAPFTGTWYKQRGTVAFPTATLPLTFWAGLVMIDDLEMAQNAGPYPADIDQIVGSLRASGGPLTLNLSYEMPLYGTISLSLHTL